MLAVPRSAPGSYSVRRMLTACACLLVLIAARPVLASCPASCPAPAGWTQSFPFAGMTWERKTGCGGPGPNCWMPENAPVDSDGVHLKLTRVSGRWYTAEIRTAQPVPPGSYSVRLIGRPDLLDPNVVLGAFLYDDAAGDRGDPCPAELDLESSRFGDPAAANGHFVTYGSGLCGATDVVDFPYSLGGTYTTHQIDWEPGSVTFRLMHGHRCAAESPEYLIAERRFDSSMIPAGGGMRLHLNLWAFAGQAPTDQTQVEVVVHDVVTSCAAVAAAAASPDAQDPDWGMAVRRHPSGGDAEIHFTLPAASPVTLSIVDVGGRWLATLVDSSLPAGPHVAFWDAGGTPAGVYFARLAVGERTVARRIVVLH
jgi:hypothetical protein